MFCTCGHSEGAHDNVNGLCDYCNCNVFVGDIGQNDIKPLPEDFKLWPDR